MYVVTIERCMRTENFPLRKIGWVITVDNGERCNATRLYAVLCQNQLSLHDKQYLSLMMTFPEFYKVLSSHAIVHDIMLYL